MKTSARAASSWHAMCSLILVAVVLSGCVSQTIVHEPYTKGVSLVVAKSANDVILKWDTEAGKYYTVLYSEHMDHRALWQPLPGYINIRGTGGTITKTISTENQQNRFYRLHVMRATGN